MASSRPPRHGGDDFGLQLALHLGARERPAAQQHHGNVGRAVELLAQCGKPYSIACGQPTGKYRLSPEGRLSRRGAGVHVEDSEHKTAVLDGVLAIAEESGTSAAQVSVAWLRARAARASTSLIPVIGPRTTAQLDEYLAALDLVLTNEQYDRLEQASTVALGTPHETAAAGLGGDAARIRRHPVPVI